MVQRRFNLSPAPRWAYAYEIVPPEAKDGMRSLETILEQAGAEARRGARSWTGRLVVEEQVTHILVVSDSPDQASATNRLIEAELTALQARYSITAPMPVDDDDDGPLPGAQQPD